MKALKHFLLFLLLAEVSFAGKLTLQVKKPNHSVVLRENKKFAEFHPNASLHWGVKYLGDWFYVEYGQKIPGTNFNSSDVGNNSYKDYRLGIYVKNFFFETAYKEYLGFSSNEEDSSKKCDLCSNRKDLTSREFHFLTMWALNPKFSMKGLTSSGFGGVKDSSSFILNLFVNRLKVRDFNGLIQNDKVSELPIFADSNAIIMRQAGMGLGYGSVTTLSSLFYFAWYAGVGAGYQNYEYQGNYESEGSGVAAHWGLRLNMGTQRKGVNGGVKGLLFSNVYDLGSDANAVSVNYALYTYLVFPI